MPRSPESLIKTVLLTAAMALGISACNWSEETTEVTYTQDKIYKLTVLYTSSFVENSSAGYIENLRTAKTALIDSIRNNPANNDRHFVLISGGSNAPESPSNLGAHLSSVGYDALVVSGYMFNQPLSYIKELEQNTSIPLISANLFESETGQPLFDGFTLTSADDLNIAVLGITSTGIEEQYRRHVSGLDIINTPGPKSARFLHRLNEQSDIVIAVTHNWHRPGNSFADMLSSFSDIDLVVGEYEEEDQLHPSENCNQWLTRIDLEFVNGNTNIIRHEKLNVLEHQALSK